MKNLKLKRINHIAIKSKNLNKSSIFYQDVLGAEKFGQTEDMVFLYLGDTDLTLEKSKGFDVASGFVNHLGFAVENLKDVDLAADWLQNNGVEIEKGPVDRSDARFIYFRDPDGNPFELFYTFK